MKIEGAMTQERRDEILESVRAVARDVIAPAADRHDLDGTFPDDSMDALHQAGLVAMTVPKEYGGMGGGLGGDHLVYHLTTYEIARACGSTALAWGHHGYIVALINNIGTEEQKKRLFSQVVSDGSYFASVGSEPRKDKPMSFDATARKVDGGYVLNGRKRYSSAAGHATFHLVWVMEDGVEDFAMALRFALVQADTEGVEIIPDWSSMGMRASATDSVVLSDVFVPDEDMIGERGALFTVPLLPLMFHTEFAANFAGVASGALDFAIPYVREQTRPWLMGGVPHATKDPYIQYRVGEMVAQREASIGAIMRASNLIQQAQDGGSEAVIREAAIASWAAKTIATEASKQITRMAFQVCGARSSREKTNFSRFWRDATTFTLHDPVDMRYQAIGDFVLGDEPYQAGVI